MAVMTNEVDELRIRSKFTKKLVETAVESVLKKQLGVKPTIKLDPDSDFYVTISQDHVSGKVSLEFELDKSVLPKLLNP